MWAQIFLVMGISGSINLTGFNKAFTEVRKNKAGESITCVTIPLEPNWLKKTDKGNVFVNFSAWPIPPEKRKEDRKDTHIVNLDPGKEVREKLKTANEYPPTLGNLVNWDELSGGESPAAQGPVDAGFTPPSDDMPF